MHFTRTCSALIFLALAGSGCSMCRQIERNLVVDPVHYCTNLGSMAIRWRSEDLAEAAWGRFAASHQTCPLSEDFERGFRDGYADYVYAGGTGEPPPVPPRRYWRHEYQNPPGHAAVADWFQGFRWGAAAAARSGHREDVVIPMAYPPQGPAGGPPPAPPRPGQPLPPTPHPVLPPGRGEVREPPGGVPAPEELPAPRRGVATETPSRAG